MSGRLLVIATIAALTGAVAQATPITIVDWGVADYVTSTQGSSRTTAVSTYDYNGDSINDRVRLMSFSEATPFSPTSGYSGTSATFYGGYDLVRFSATSGDPALADSLIMNGGASSSTTDDAFGWRFQISDSLSYFAGAVVWKKSDFLNDGHLGTNKLFFDTTSSLKVSVGDNNSTTLRWENIHARWLVKEGSQWYVSQTALATGTGDKTLTFASASSDGFWAPISFSSGVGVNLDALTYSDTNFTDIVGVGLYITSRADRQPNTANNIRYWWYVDDFEVVAAIPEPATASLLLGAGALLMAFRRSRRG